MLTSTGRAARRPVAALVIAHPGHELRVHGWLERARPRVFVLGDGSGPGGRPRLESCRRVLDRAGAEAGSVFGRLTDAALYQAVLDRDAGLFAALADELTAELAGVRVVAGDAAGGYNPAHDLCRMLVNVAVSRLAARGPAPSNLDFALDGPADDGVPRVRNGAVRVRLDDRAFARKLAAARSYPELAGDVDRVLREQGEDAYRVECLRPVRAVARSGEPFYERHGERRVAEGRYRRVIRYHDHVRPLEVALATGAVSAA